MLKPSDYHKPDRHPFGMLAGQRLSHTSEAEWLLTWMLVQCQEKGSWAIISTDYTHPGLVDAGLLEEVGDRQYRLTRLSRGLLYAYYGIEEKVEDLLENPAIVPDFTPLTRDEANER